MKTKDEKTLTPLEAALHLGITTELLFHFTKRNFGKSRGFRALETIEQHGQTRFSLSELDEFDCLLAGPWSDASEDRPAIPKAILDHLRAESRNQCARCGSGIGVDTAHIRPWKDSRSHHPHNLIRICSACHREHDSQNSLSTEELQTLKDRLVAGTRANLKERMHPLHKHLRPPRPLRDFVGRENELETLIDALQSGRSATVFGVAGIGKSELVLQALDRCETGRPVLWCNIEQYRKVTNVMSALRTALSIEGIECSDDQLPSRLDAMHACIVFDGIEQSGLDNLDEFEDTVDTLFRSTSDTQFVSTSQILLHRMPAEAQLRLGRLKETASRSLLRQSCGRDDETIYGEDGELLKFCDGHTLAIKLAGALTAHYGSTAAALDAINNRGTESVSLPGRKHHTRLTSFERCLQTAYETLERSSRQALWALAQAPAGVLTDSIDRVWLDLDDIADAVASLRKWHLIETSQIENEPSRTRILTPIRRYVNRCGRDEDRDAFDRIVGKVVRDFAVMVAVIELNYDTPEDTPYALWRFGHEYPNLLHVLELARERQDNEEIVTTALSIVQSLMRFFFVLRLPEQGAHVLYDATDLAVRSGHFERASRLAMQFLTLAQRSGDEALIATVGCTVDQIASATTDLEVLSDVAMCRALTAQSGKNFPEAERQARQAFEGYRTLGRALKGKTEADDDLELQRHGLHNDISNSLGMLGFALLSQEKFQEASQAYRHSLQHQRGSSIGVNRGQTLHQIGNCESNLGNHEAAAKLYLEAASIFHFIGMEEYLSNAFGELGYALLDSDLPEAVDQMDDRIVDHALSDLNKDVNRVFDPERPLDHQQCIGMIRKVFGIVTLLSLVGHGEKLGPFCMDLGNKVVAGIAGQIDAGVRATDERFPIFMIDVALRLGILVAECENDLRMNGDVADDTVGNILRTVCEAHKWAQDTMRILDWTAVYLARRLQFKGIDNARIREFATNYRDDVVDHLDLVR